MITRQDYESKLLIDKVAFTLPIPANMRLRVLSRISGPDLNKDYKIRVYQNRNGRYKNNYQVTIFGRNTIELSMYPINKHHNFLRVEYNPSKLGSDGRKELRIFLSKLLGKDIVKQIYHEASVTRLDLTLDVYNLEPNLYIHKSGVIVSKMYQYQETGDIISQVVGSNSSRNRITMYDKDLEMEARRQTISVPGCQRIEIRFRDLGCSMRNLNPDLVNEFCKLNFFSSCFLDDRKFSSRFKRNALNYGLNYALNIEDKNKRRRYMRYLSDYSVNPITIADGSFERAHSRAFKSLVNMSYYDEVLAAEAA